MSFEKHGLVPGSRTCSVRFRQKTCRSFRCDFTHCITVRSLRVSTQGILKHRDEAIIDGGGGVCDIMPERDSRRPQLNGKSGLWESWKQNTAEPYHPKPHLTPSSIPRYSLDLKNSAKQQLTILQVMDGRVLAVTSRCAINGVT